MNDYISGIHHHGAHQGEYVTHHDHPVTIDAVHGARIPANDDRFAQLQDITDVPEHTLAEIEHFFSHYKEIEHGKHVTTNGWADRAAAEAVIRTAQEAHTRHP